MNYAPTLGAEFGPLALKAVREALIETDWSRPSVNHQVNRITRACDKAKAPRWNPNQLRHNRATEERREYGLKVARIILGHKIAVITRIYAEATCKLRRRASHQRRLRLHASTPCHSLPCHDR